MQLVSWAAQAFSSGTPGPALQPTFKAVYIQPITTPMVSLETGIISLTTEFVLMFSSHKTYRNKDAVKFIRQKMQLTHS